MRRLVAIIAIMLSLLPSVALAQSAPACQFELGFLALDKLIPTPAGSCLENENHNPLNGDGLQHTQGGLMVWRKADNWTAFTDGYHTWINGPLGLQERLNSEQFPWEQAEQAQTPAVTLLDLSGTNEAYTPVINPKGNFSVAYTYRCPPNGLGFNTFDIFGEDPSSHQINDNGTNNGDKAFSGQSVAQFTHAGPQVLHILADDGCTWHITVTG